ATSTSSSKPSCPPSPPRWWSALSKASSKTSEQRSAPLAVSHHVHLADTCRLVPPGTADVAQYGGDLGVIEHMGERPHAEGARITLGGRQETAVHDDPHQVDRRVHQHRTIPGQGRIEPPRTFTLAAVTGGAVLAIQLAPLGHQGGVVFIATRCGLVRRGR